MTFLQTIMCFPSSSGDAERLSLYKCNNTFGHTFEGEASKQLARIQVSISHFGLDLTRNPAVWPSALVTDGMQLDLTSGPDGAQYHLSKPVIHRDEEGNVTSYKARSKSEGNRIAKGLIDSGKAKRVEMSPDESRDLENIKARCFSELQP